jgi:hypothetical protein
MCLRRAPEKYIAGAALDRAALEHIFTTNSYVDYSFTFSTENVENYFLKQPLADRVRAARAKS